LLGKWVLIQLPALQNGIAQHQLLGLLFIAKPHTPLNIWSSLAVARVVDDMAAVAVLVVF
jgi:hypothetical protein